MKKERFLSIDIIRALAIVAVIAIHVFSFNLTSSRNTFIWNYLHFIIVAFLFCSGFVLFAKYKDMSLSWKNVGSFYNKRLIRIVLPFYIYLGVHYALIFLFPTFFSGLGIKFNWGYLLDSVILLDGVALNWLPLLFVQTALLFPLLLYFYQKKKALLWVYLLVGLGSLIGFSIYPFPYQYYRYVMWFPWSLFFVLPWYYFQQKETMFGMRKNMMISLFCFFLYGCIFFVWQHLHRPLNLIDNKYPPNIFYVSYELAGTTLILAFTHFSLWRNTVVKKSILFLSQFSYALFFVHYILIDFTLQIQKTFGFRLSVWIQFVFVFGMSTGIVFLYSQRTKLLSPISKLAILPQRS